MGRSWQMSECDGRVIVLCSCVYAVWPAILALLMSGTRGAGLPTDGLMACWIDGSLDVLLVRMYHLYNFALLFSSTFVCLIH